MIKPIAMNPEPGARIPWWYWLICWDASERATRWQVPLGRRSRAARALALLAALAAGCATAPPAPPRLPPPALPPAVDIDRLLPLTTLAPPVPPGLPDFPDYPLDEGQCKGVPAGILLSERSYAQCVADGSAARRLATEARALRTLRAEERAAAVSVEQAYRERVAALEAALARSQAASVSSWKFWVGLGVGAVVTGFGAWAASRDLR